MYRNLNYKTLDKEKWKPIKKYDGLYEVSSLGRIRSIFLFRQDKNGIYYKHKPIILKQSFTSTGYLKVKLKGKDFKVHRLVAEAFLENKRNKECINHKDFNPLNNRVENLEWCSQKENIEYNVKNNKIYRKYYYDKNIIIDLYKKGFSALDISNKLKISKDIIYYVVCKNKINRKIYNRKSKYNFNINDLKKDIMMGIKNKDISKKYNIPTSYIARRKYQIKKGEI